MCICCSIHKHTNASIPHITINKNTAQYAEIFSAFPTRKLQFAALHVPKCCIAGIMAVTGMSRSSASHAKHVKKRRQIVLTTEDAACFI